jgi:hypothetical protein
MSGTNSSSSRREFLQFMAAMAATPQPAQAAPAVVYVFADQMRFCDLGCAFKGARRIRGFHDVQFR